MSIEIDWEVTDAPSGDDDTGAPQRPPDRHSQPPGPPANEPQPAGRQRRPWWIAVPIGLALVAALGLNYVTRLGWQRISADVIALVRYEEQRSKAGDLERVLRVQDYSNAQWLAVRTAQVAANRPAPLPVPVLTPAPDTAEIGPLELIETELVRTEVLRHYETPDGQVVTFALPQFYRRQGPNADWVRTNVPDSYWGAWHDWQSPHLFVRHSQRDQALVDKLGPRLEATLSAACQLWGNACDGLPPAKLYLSGFVGSLEYDPLANVRVRVEFGQDGSEGGLPADYFLSVPSPQLAGLPADPATEQYLTDYLAVRLIAALADTATATQREAEGLTTEAVNRLGLGDADPGFAGVSHDRPRGEAGVLSTIFSRQNAAGETVAVSVPAAGLPLVTRLNPPAPLTTYAVQPGDTLLGIAADYGVSLESVILLNGIENPDAIQADSVLLIPPGGED